MEIYAVWYKCIYTADFSYLSGGKEMSTGSFFGVLWMGLQLQSMPQYCNDSWNIAGTFTAGIPAWIQSPISARNGPCRLPSRHDWTQPTSLWPACWWGVRGGQLHIQSRPQGISCSLERGGQWGHSSQVRLLKFDQWGLSDYIMPVLFRYDCIQGTCNDDIRCRSPSEGQNLVNQRLAIARWYRDYDILALSGSNESVYLLRHEAGIHTSYPKQHSSCTH